MEQTVGKRAVWLLSAAFFASAALHAAASAPQGAASVPGGASVRRVLLPEPLGAPLRRESAIERANWVWHPSADGWTNRFLASQHRREMHAFPSGWTTNVFLRFMNEFDVDRPATIRFHVSADERFVLSLDGSIVSRGPHRSCVKHWSYQSYDADLEPGRHVFSAVVWRVGPSAPCAQMSWQGGFIFAAEGDPGLAKSLSTGTAGSRWKVSDLGGPLRRCSAAGASFCGGRLAYEGRCPFFSLYPGEVFVEPCVLAPGGRNSGYGFLQQGWRLSPSPLPDQAQAFRSAGVVKAIAPGPVSVRDHYVTVEETRDPRIAAWNDFLSGRSAAIEIPPRTALTLYCDIGDYVTGFPVLETGSSASGRINMGFQERGVPPPPAKGARRGPHPHRGECVGTRMPGNSGFASYRIGPGERHEPFWWGAGRWLVVEIATGAGKTVLTRLGVLEDRYPLELESSFSCDDASFDGISRICARTMQMCAHETLMDCPHYEQQMYPGDTRVQLLALAAMTGDARMSRRAISLFDWSRDDDGLLRMNYPCWMNQNSASYTLCWPLMLKDHAMWRNDPEWLRARVPGLRHTMSAFELREGVDGLLERMPYWNFFDWAGSHTDGDCDGDGRGLPALMDLFHLLAMDSAAYVERALGDEAMARRWEEKAARKRSAVLAAYWSEKRGLLRGTRSTPDGGEDARADVWTEHAQVLGILSGVLDGGKAARVMSVLASPDPDPANDGWRLARSSVYFNHYAFEAFAAMGRADLVQERFGLWRSYLADGLSTCVESPGGNARSDCHAWGAHPLYQMHATFAGVRPAAPFFSKVRVAPQPGSLRKISARTPHPRGWICTGFAFDGNGGVSGTVELPDGVTGEFVWQGRSTPLSPGINRVGR